MRSLRFFELLAIVTLTVCFTGCSGAETPAEDAAKDQVKDAGKDGAKHSSKDATASTPDGHLLRDLDKMTAAMRAGDMDAFVALMPPNILKADGNEAAELAKNIASNPDVLAILKSTVFEKPGAIVVTDQGQAAIVRFKAEVHENGKQIGYMKSGMLAISEDDGQTWQFMDIGGDGSRKRLLEWKPNLHAKVVDQLPTFAIEPLK